VLPGYISVISNEEKTRGIVNENQRTERMTIMFPDRGGPRANTGRLGVNYKRLSSHPNGE